MAKPATSSRITETDMRLALFLKGGGSFYDREICRKLRIHRNTYIRSLKRLVEADVLSASPAKRGPVPEKRVFTINTKSPAWDVIAFFYPETVSR